ncbi:hypothetical protein [Ktedonobacter racemifer]|uniref:Uncharacterized protein n=1 Tax=Ktedonobacter racemifer DSM 44963 TaxID=485913 RepID=D6TEI2_KTERA|nr:hypothetical protein [Ktedonobacter racemifer]EFH90355.1 hypothetical protein Krac_11973 [Ktedonobacter racemifer DSM 44963]
MTTQKPFSDLVLEATAYLTRVDLVLAQTIQWVVAPARSSLIPMFLRP